MLGENKNLKDTSKNFVKDTNLPIPNLPLSKGGEQGRGLPYTKTNKLITALYMVTDTMDKEEPIRLKLRTLGIEILSDITSLSRVILTNLEDKIASILSFLTIAGDIRMISEMNHSILKKEFLELKQSIQESKTQDHLWLEEFINEGPAFTGEGRSFVLAKDRPSPTSVSLNKGQSTRIGVQKGSTLLKALSKVEDSFGTLKNKRREEIINIIKDKKSTHGIDGLPANLEVGATIKDIKNGAKGVLVSCGEKTLQRELISMVKDNVLKKTGEKRWSSYSVI